MKDKTLNDIINGTVRGVVGSLLFIAAYKLGEQHAEHQAVRAVTNQPPVLTVTFAISPDSTFGTTTFVTNIPASLIDGAGYVRIVPVLSEPVELGPGWRTNR